MLGKSTSIYTYTYTYSSRKYAVCAESALANKVYIDVLPVWSCVAKSVERGELCLQGSLVSRKFPILSFSEFFSKEQISPWSRKKLGHETSSIPQMWGEVVSTSQWCQTLVTLWIVAPQATLRVISQASTLEWVVISHSGGSSRPGDRTCLSCVSCIGRPTPIVPPGKSRGGGS